MREYLHRSAEVEEVVDADYDEYENNNWDDLEMVWSDVVTIVGDEETARQVWDYLIGVKIPGRSSSDARSEQ